MIVMTDGLPTRPTGPTTDKILATAWSSTVTEAPSYSVYKLGRIAQSTEAHKTASVGSRTDSSSEFHRECNIPPCGSGGLE